MSAVFGIVDASGERVEKKSIHTMLDAMPYKYSDDSATLTDGAVAFGHIMLWSTPESRYERLPCRKDDFIITTDARLDNRTDLMKKLSLTERPQDQITDSDLILEAYKKWGEACPRYLVGDFAFAIWDAQHHQLFCARDHLGIRPFYYSLSTGNLTFSSTMDSLLAIRKAAVKENTEALASFTCYSTVAYDQTLYKEIMRLPMGSSMTYKEGVVHTERYWKPETIKQNRDITFQEAAEKAKELFDEAVSARLRSYSDVGCELSGGIDSSSVVCSVSQLAPDKKIALFSQRYGDYACDEGEYIDEVTKKTGLDTYSVRCDKIDYTHEYDMRFNYHINRHWPLYVTFTQSFPLAEKMREEGIRILLTGQGGDHLFEGSVNVLRDYFQTFQFKKMLDELKHYQFTKTALARFLLSPLLSKSSKKFLKKLLAVFRLSKAPAKTAYFNEERCIYPYDITEDIHFSSHSFKYDILSIAGNRYAMWIDSFSYQFFEQNYGIEVRHPFFDVRLVEFALSLPAEYKLQKHIGKAVFREAMKKVLPEKIRCRKDKAEFSEVILDQIACLDLDELFKDSEIVKRGYLSQHQLERLRSEYHLPQNTLMFWRIVNVEYWLKNV